MKKDKHEHRHTIIKLIPIVIRRDEPYGILARFCECGNSVAFEMGPRDEMVTLGKRIKNANI